MTFNLGRTGAWTAASPPSSGFSTVDVILIIVAAVAVLVVAGRLAGRLALRPRGTKLWRAHDEEVKQAAAADVEALKRDDRLISPDAPGVQEDDL